MMEHQSVLLHETVDMLQVKPDGIYVDGTLGRGGHAELLLSKLSKGHLYGFDRDEQALKETAIRLESSRDRITMIHENFCHMKEVLEGYGVSKVDGIMMDLGVSSPQFDDPERGFSYRYDANLDMRMDQTQSLTAMQIVNEYSFEDLTRILWQYGEERDAKRIARAIERQRAISPIETTFQLNDVIRSCKSSKELSQKGHPAKQTFQALRIEVNGELTSLRTGLEEATSLLNLHGRLAVITFHSLEDRMVKSLFKDLSSAPSVAPKLPVKASQMEQASFLSITKHPVTASELELQGNHRAHSAKLRVLEKIGD